MTDPVLFERIARACHEVNRAYCASLGDHSQVAWEEAPEWQRETVRLGVRLHIDNPNTGPQASHNSWMSHKRREGWVYGSVKNEIEKTHPCMVPFERLPPAQRAKDFIFRAVVLSMAY